MAEMRSIEREWLQFRLLDIAHNAPDVQLKEMRKAFYAGAASALAIVVGDGVRMSAETRRLTPVALLQEIQRYLDDWKRSGHQVGEKHE